MLRVTKLADYAIVMLTCFASHGGATHNARDVAREARLPLPVVSKVLKRLTREGLLTSHRGIRGGYGLARQPHEITVADIIRALEGPIAVTECADKVKGDCGLETKCPVRANWHMINQAIHGALGKITLAEMARPLQQQYVNISEPLSTGQSGTTSAQVL
ncbi:MAG: SUF system Fe-S cluster assembly regulator [Acidobacteria bacterium]|nr:SUF system Fe-S cluster assembly regulator [Acidobacteriota bacterium]